MKTIFRDLSISGGQKIAILVFQILLIGHVSVMGQTATAVLKGNIRDEASAIIPYAHLRLKDGSGLIRETMSDESGTFSFGDLPLGVYELTVTKEGFADVVKSIMLDGRSGDPSMTMAVQDVTATVTVIMDSAEAAVNSTLKSDVSMHETPRSITAIGSERIAEQNFQQVADVINYVPGVTQNSYRNGSYHFYARGYRMGPEDTRVDGSSGVNVGSGGFGASLFGIEEAVVLRGPASLLYGQTGSPGGLINLVSKRPREDRFTQIGLRTGGYAGNGVSLTERPILAVDVDTTGPITESGRILYRGLAMIENANYFTAGTLDRNRYINGSLLIKLDRDGRYVITPSAQFTRYFRPFGGGIIASPSSSLSASATAQGDPVKAPINHDDLSPLDVNLFGGRRVEETGWAGLDFRGVPSNNIRVNAAYRYVSFDTDIDSFTPQVSSAAQIRQLRENFTVSRVQAKSLTERNYHNLNADVSYEWIANSWIRNTTQAGVYTRSLISRTTSPQGTIPGPQSPINIYTGAVESPLADMFPEIAFGAWETDTVINGFVQNRTSLAGGKVNIGLGFNYGQQRPSVGAVRKSGIIPNASILYNATPEIAIYASYSTSYLPVDPTLQNAEGVSGTFSPTTGKSYEVGTKYDLLDRRLSLAFALFQNQIDNALVQSDIGVLNQNGNRFYIPAGTRRARGAEATVHLQVRHDLYVTGGAAYTSAIYLGFPDGTSPSSSPIPNSWAEKTPRFTYNAYARYDRSEGRMKGFGAGLGWIGQGSRIGSNGPQTFAAPDPIVLPSFNRIDSALFYRLNRWVNFALNVENVFDELIFVNGSVGSSIEIAAPRTVSLRTTFSF